MGVLPVCDTVAFDALAVCSQYIGYEEGILLFSAFVELGQHITSDSWGNGELHDASIFFSGQQNAFVFQLNLDFELVNFFP